MIAILATEADLPRAGRVWGQANRSGTAKEREACSWLTLARLLGWQAEVIYEIDAERPRRDDSCLIVARDPASVGEDEVTALEAWIETEPALVVTRAPAEGAPLARLTGSTAAERFQVEGELRWAGPGAARAWTVWPRLGLHRLHLDEGCEVSARIADAPLASARRRGRGLVVSVAAHPVELADAAPSGTGLLRHLLTATMPGSPAWLDLEGWVALRMDDPGGAARAYLDGWAHRSMSAGEWRALGAELRRREARLTVGYVPGWIDDGDLERGALLVGGDPVDRIAGRVHPSPLVTYRAGDGVVHDHQAELASIDELRREGACELEPHGYTHVRPYREAIGAAPYADWLAASDRYTDAAWYREFEDFPPGATIDPVAEGVALLREHARDEPAVLCCPGLACSIAATERALDSGLELISAETLAIRDGERFVWSDHIHHPFVDGAAGPWLESGFPVVSWFHDRDIVLHGTDWLSDWLDQWQAHGARRFCDLRELAATLRLGARR